MILFHSVQSSLNDYTLKQFLSNYTGALLYCDLKEIVTESFAITDMTDVTGDVLFRSESKGSGFHANERPQGGCKAKKNSKFESQKITLCD